MSGGAGHIADMISRNRTNNTLLKNKGYFEVNGKYLKAASAKKIDFRKATRAELEAVRKTIRTELKKDKRRKMLALSLSLLAGMLVIYGIITLLSTTI